MTVVGESPALWGKRIVSHQKYVAARQIGDIMAEQSIEFRYDTQLLIEGCEMDEDDLREYIINNFVGDSYAGGGDEDLMKVHYHTNEPWKILEYCRTLGEIFDIVVEDMDRQSRGLQG